MAIYPKDYMDIINDLERNQEELNQSLEYASYIQRALLPKINELHVVFPESFIFFKPRDIVSGDFYWIYRDSKKTYIALGDCTGHGVPGAFLSILGISFLNLVISKHKSDIASEVLNILREYVMKALNQTGNEVEQKDGIDLTLCIIDKNTNTLQFSGAFSVMYVVRKGELIQLIGDKMPIGVSASFEESFKNQSLKLEIDDMLYLFSDGFPDQFGGEEGKKYKYGKFRKLVTEISDKSAKKQKDLLISEFFNWKGDLQQIDDTTVIGIRYT